MGNIENMKKKTKEQAEAIERLREWVKPGDIIYTVIRGVSSTGMTRYIDVYKFDYSTEDKRIYKTRLSGMIARAGIFSLNKKRECLTVGGCGMDMGHHVVYTLASALAYTRYHTEDKQDAAPYTNCYGLNHEWL